MLSSVGLGKTFGPVTALHRLDLEVERGQIAGLVGNNGAGKSTALKLLTGLLEPTHGRVTLDGQPTMEASVRAKLGFLPEDSPLYEDETALSYLLFFSSLYRVPGHIARPRAESLLTRLRLAQEHWKKPIAELSKGSARKVAIARALMHDPALLLLDEPQSGLDPQSRADLDRFLLELRDQGTAIVLSAHNLLQVETLCDHVTVLRRGRVAAAGSLGALQGQFGSASYEILSTVPFPASQPKGSLHLALLPDVQAMRIALDAIHAAGGYVVSMQRVGGRLADILEQPGDL